MSLAGDTNVIGRRIGALALDAIVATAIVVLVGIAIADRTDYAGALRDHDCTLKEDSSGDRRVYCSAFAYHDGVTDEDGTYVILDPGPAAMLALGAGFVTFVLAPMAFGASPGKLAAGVRVVRADGSRARLGSLTVRWLLLAVDGALTIGICGLATVLRTADHQRVGDLAAGTYVVRKRGGSS